MNRTDAVDRSAIGEPSPDGFSAPVGEHAGAGNTDENLKSQTSPRGLKRERSAQLKASEWAIGLNGLLLIAVFIYTHSVLFLPFGITFALLSLRLYLGSRHSVLWSVLIILISLNIMAIGFPIFMPLAIPALAGAIVVFLHNVHMLNNAEI